MLESWTTHLNTRPIERWYAHTTSRDLEDVLTFYAELLTGSPPDAAWRKRLLAALGPGATWEPDTVRAGIALVVASPEVQMA